MKRLFAVLLIFVLVFTLSFYILAAAAEPAAVNSVADASGVSAVSSPATGDIGIVIAFAVCGATAFLTIKLTRNKNKI